MESCLMSSTVFAFEKVGPAFVVLGANEAADEWPHFGFGGLADQFQSCFVGQAICLECIAVNGGSDDVFPSGFAAAVAGDDVIDVEHLGWKNLTRVLAAVAVPLKNALSGEFDLLNRNAIKGA